MITRVIDQNLTDLCVTCVMRHSQGTEAHWLWEFILMFLLVLVKTKIIKIFLVRAFFQQPSQYIVRSRLADIIGEAMDSTLSLLLFSNSTLTDSGNISTTKYSLLCWITPWISNIHFEHIQQSWNV